MDDIISEIITLLQTQFGSEYKKYFYGENIIPEQAIFPFLEVVPESTSVNNRGTGGTKNNQFSVKIKIKDTIKNFLNHDTNQTQHEAMQKTVQRMEERDGGNFKSTSVLYVLANNLKLGGKANISDDWKISYDSLPFNGSYIIMSSVTFNVNLLSYV